MSRQKRAILPIGTISAGTLKPEDLIPSFLWELERLRLTRAERGQVRSIRSSFDAADRVDDSKYWEEFADEDLQTLTEILESHVPDYCYFGTLEGDGAEFGVWVSPDLLQDTTQGSFDGCVWRSPQTPGESIGEMREVSRGKYSHWLHVNDHGNATLYRKAGNRWIEVWGIV